MSDLPQVIETGFLGAGSSGFDFGTLALLIPAIIGLTILMRSTFRRSARSRSAQRVPVRERFAAATQKSIIDRSSNQVSIELDRFARHLMGQLDTRFAKLQDVIQLADERIAKLTLLEKSGTQPAAGDAGHTGRLSAKHRDSLTASSRESDEQNSAANANAHAAESAVEVYRLADGGLAPPAIAERIGRPYGEVELMLALRRVHGEAKATRSPTSATVPKS